MLSASKELEPGVRAMLLLAAGLFRLDVVVHGDTLRTIVRNLSPGGLEMGDTLGSYGRGTLAFGDVAAYEPGNAELSFDLGTGADRVTVRGTLATLSFTERGTVRVTAQAIVRHVPRT